MRRRVHVEEHMGELNIVPYLDVVVNLVMFMLLSMTGLISLGVLNVTAPQIAVQTAGATESAPKLLLNVSIGKAGFYIAGAGGVLGADAAEGETNRPPTIPLKDGKYDYGTLTAQLVKIKEKYPSETQVIIAADREVLYDVLVQTMDACREQVVKKDDGTNEHKPLFYDVSLGEAG